MQSAEENAPRPPRMRAVAAAVSIVALGLPVAYYVIHSTTLVFCPSAWKQVDVGMSRQAVETTMGSPVQDCEVAVDDVETCLVSGNERPAGIYGVRFYVYFSCGKAFYIFFDEDERVVHYWWGNS